MYEVDSNKFTSKPNPRTEFIHYFKESGAATALQKAMLLLYKMPVKQCNLAEFFYQYFENGAQQLLRISLLKAELCYKRDELQNRRMKVTESEDYMKQLVKKLQISDDEFNQNFVPEWIKEKTPSTMDQYLNEVVNKMSQKSKEVDTKMSSNIMGAKVESTIPVNSNYDLENHCVKNVKSENILMEDIKDLDPWGIICKGSKKGEEVKKNVDKNHDDLTSDINEDEHEADDDDAASLAEYFQQSSRDWIAQEKDERAVKIHNQLLTVKNADKTKLTDFMGWTPLQSRENDVLLSSVLSNEPFSHDPVREGEYMEGLKRRHCLEQKVDLYASLKSADADPNTAEPDNDAFLLEEDHLHLEHAYKLMETNQDSFEYELQRHSRSLGESHQEELCYPICDLVDALRLCSASGDSFDNDSATYGEDEFEHLTENESLGFVPGKMTNWTTQYAGYPLSCSAGEYFEIQEKRKKQKNKLDGKTPFDVPLVRIDSSCHCVLTGIYETDEMLSEDATTAEEKVAEVPAVVEIDKSDRKSSKKGGRVSHQKDEATLTEDSALETELQEVFKHKQVRRSLTHKEKFKREEEEETKYGGDPFGIDLAKEVKRTILGIKPAETSSSLADADNTGHHQTSATISSKFQGIYHNLPVSNTAKGMIIQGQK